MLVAMKLESTLVESNWEGDWENLCEETFTGVERSQANKSEGKSLWAGGIASDGKELGEVQGERPK